MSLNIKTATGLLEIGGKVTKEEIISALGYEPANGKIETTAENHISDTDVHITSDERELWTTNVENLNSHKSDTAIHVTSEEKQTWNNHKVDTTIHITDEERTKWNAAQTHANSAHARVDATLVEGSDTNGNITINGVETVVYTHPDGEHITSAERNSWNAKADVTYIDAELAKKSDSGHTHDQYLEAEDIADKADKTELHEHSNKTVLDGISADKISSWDNKSDFSGDYNDLENAPNIYEDGSDNLVIADRNGNIIFKSDANGFETTTLTAQTVVVNGINVETALNGAIGKGSTGQYAEIFNDYDNNIASGAYSHAEGCNTTVTNDATLTATLTTSTEAGMYGHAEGYGTVSYGNASHAEGNGTTASGNYSHAEGKDTTASGYSSHAEGYDTTADGNYSHAEGYGTTASGYSSHAEGGGTTASGDYSHAGGGDTIASGHYSHAEGYGTIASGVCSHAEGYSTIANQYQYVVGKYNTSTTAPTSVTDTATSAGLFIVGIGTSDSARSNGFRITPAGKVYGTGVFGTSGADYAEYFEWFDGNPNNEDRRGRFVTLDGGKIRYATSNDDYILGVVSANPSVAGDIQSESWHNMYLKDIYGSQLVEVVEVEETTNENGEIIPAHTESRWVLNPDYNPDVKYISREERPEWAAIGIVGKLVVVDDGTCQVNGYCYPNVDGIVTASQEKTNYRVMERLDDTHIRIFIK